MLLKIQSSFYQLLKSTKFWQENYLIARELRHFPKVVAIALTFTLMSAVLQGLGVGFILTFLQSLTEPDASPIQTGITWIDINILGIYLSPIERIYRTSAVLLVTTTVQAIFTSVGMAYSGEAQSRLVLQLQNRIFQQLQHLNLSYFTETRAGHLINGLTAETAELKSVFETISFLIVRGSILTVYTISMVCISWQLTLAIIIIFGFISVLTSKLFALIREVSFKMTKARNCYASSAIEFINGIRTIQVSAAQDLEQQRINEATFHVFAAERQSWRVRALIEPVPEAITTLVALSILLLSFTVLIPSGYLSVASLLTFLFIIIRLLPIVRQLNSARGRISRYQGAVEATKELLSSHGKSFFMNGYREFRSLEKKIEFQAVDFAYNIKSPVLQNIDLTINRGEMTALVGASGAGKTTLADLVPRFYEPTKGKILIDGIDLQEIEINSLRRRMAVVSQDTFIFNTSVRENIAYAMKGVEDGSILKAAEMANALEFIQELSEGLDTQLGDRGVLLSGGQRQRIGIARALLRDPEILILDEATSALDSVSERLIQKSIEELIVGRTVIVIAHRLSTIIQADKIVVLERGRIVEEGGYQELLERRGRLWKYHQMQYQKGEELMA